MDPAQEPAVIEFGRFTVIPDRRELLADGKPLEVGGRAFDVLMVLIGASGSVVSKDTLMDRVWPNRIVDENRLQSQIATLRRAFGAERDLIRTIAGRGYQFSGTFRTTVTTSARAAFVAPQPTPAPSRTPTNLSERVSDLIGRDAELDEILELSSSHRLVTLAGPGGIGKTRLCYEAARRLLPRFADGVWVAELAPVSDPEFVAITVATAVGLGPSSGTMSLASVANTLRSKRALLVLDNCEHVIAEAARMADALLHASPAVHLMATSRESLRIDGELVYTVPPLAVPAADSKSSEDPLRYGAVQLFVERARASAPNLPPDTRVLAAIAGICRHLDGIPLAIELAAARATTLGVEGLAAGLDDRFRLLTGGRRTAMPRHRTLQATLDWSYELLTEPERVVLRRLAVFAGSFTLQAAEQVAADDKVSASGVIDCVANLIEKSLLTVDAGGGAMMRYRLLETTRAYALEKLIQSGEYDVAARRHATRYRQLFEGAEAEAETRPTDEWLAVYGPRIDNVRAALDWAFSPKGDAALGVSLTIAAVPLWVQLSQLDECRERVERALASLRDADSANDRARMQLSAALGWSLMYGVGRVREAGPAWAATLEIAERLDDRDYKQRALWGLCIDQFNNGEFRTALDFAKRFAALVADSNDPVDLLMGDRILATSLHYIGDQNSARLHIDRVIGYLEKLAHQPQIVRLRFDMRVSTHYFQARILWLQGFADQALRAVEHNIEEGRAIGHALSFCSVLGQGACPIAFLAGDFDAAARYGAMLLDHTERHPMRLWQQWARCFNGMVMARRGDLATGLDALRDELERVGDAKFLPRFLLPLGEFAAFLGEAGEIAQGIAIVDAALERCKTRDEGWFLAELLRIRGDLVLRSNGAAAALRAEEEYLSALDCARSQGAFSWELRAATSLARLLREQGRSSNAKALLQPVHERFTEGFATADLTAARTLLGEL